jgi:hypothetical protein
MDAIERKRLENQLEEIAKGELQTIVDNYEVLIGIEKHATVFATSFLNTPLFGIVYWCNGNDQGSDSNNGYAFRYLEYMVGSPEDEKYKEYFDTIEKAEDHLKNIMPKIFEEPLGCYIKRKYSVDFREISFIPDLVFEKIKEDIVLEKTTIAPLRMRIGNGGKNLAITDLDFFTRKKHSSN